MPLYSKESLESLRQRIDLVEVISSHVDMKPSGAAYKGLCPFHDEKSPSFMIHKGDKHYHCFGCGAHGDAIQFLMEMQRLSFTDAVESLAQKFHVHLEVIEGTNEHKGPPKGKIKEALQTACQFFQFSLLHTQEGQEALQYLYKRGLTLEFIQQFQIGLAPKAYGLFRDTMYAKSISNEIMIAAGLMKETEEGKVRDFFYDRITFPIHNASGAVIGFSARKYREETFGGKYVNTPETVLFKKSRVLFGIHHCRRRIAKERKVIIVEGQIDALRLIYEGFNITVAGQGTAFGEDHVKELLNLGVNQVYLSLDSDAAGLEAAMKIGNLFQKEGVEVYIVRMPMGKDPDSYLIERGPDAFANLMENSMEYLSFLVEYRSRGMNLNSPAAKTELVQRISQQIRSWEHSLMIHESLRKLAHLVQVPEDMVGVGQDYIPNIHIRKSASIGTQTVNPNRILEADFLRWLLLYGQKDQYLIQTAQSNVRLEDLKDSACAAIYQSYLACVSEEKSLDLLSLIQDMDEVEGQQLIQEIVEKKVNPDMAEEHLVETIKKILDRNWMERREEVRRKIQSGTSSDEEVLLLVKEFDELRRNQPEVKVVTESCVL